MAIGGFSDALLVVMANAARGAITHAQLHSADPGAAGTANAIGTRQAVTWNAAAGSGAFDLATAVEFTGLTANVAVWGVSLWSAGTGGTCYGDSKRGASDDATANAAGEYTLTELTVAGDSTDANA